MEVIIASKNKGKIAEIKSYFSDLNIKFLSLLDFENVPEIIEDGNTFRDNALKKAFTIFIAYNKPVLSDDSGLVVPILNGEPGVHSARYSGKNATDKSNNEKLLKELSKYPNQDDREAFFKAVLILYLDKDKFIEADGEIHGVIGFEEKGDNGFGYDPLFYLPSIGKTTAQISMEEKSEISHRGKALHALKKHLQSLEI